MGIVFVILIHFLVIFFLSVIIAIVGSIITYFVSDKEKRKRKIFTAAISPFIGLYSLYIFGFIGSIIVSESKNIDIGIGDTWYVPLENNCQLLFIDLPEQAYIEKDGQTILSEVSQIEENGKIILGKTNDKNYFSYNTDTNELKNFTSENELTFFNSNKKPKLVNATDYYSDKRNKIAGFWLIAVGIISLILSISILYLLQKLILRNYGNGK